VNKYTQAFSGEICVMIDKSGIPDVPYGVYSFIEDTLIGAYYFEDEKSAQEKYQKIVNNLKEVKNE
jgi:hypothetical protein